MLACHLKVYITTCNVPTLGHNSLIVVGVDAHTVTLEVESILAELGVAELILVEVRPSPDPGVDHMGKTLPSSDLIKWKTCECVNIAPN